MRGAVLTPLEVASGVVFDEEVEAPRLDAPDTRGTTPIEALERAILAALLRPPCLVSFSGGRDSSAVLAVAARVARREGLPLPIPATNRFPEAKASDESEWQELVVSWLDLPDWHRPEFTDELDVVGPVATSVLRRHGLLWPCNAHFHVPLFERAAGGSLLTGAGGDEIFSAPRWARANAVLAGRARPVPRDVLRVAVALAPRRVRRVAIERRLPEGWSWLHPEARRSVLRKLASAAAGEPRRWRTRLNWIPGRRYLEVGLSSLALLASDSDVAVAHPLLDPGFAAAMARLPKADRFADRTSAMELLFADVLPRTVLSRSGKAQFDGAFWTEHCRALLARWDGEGIDESLVDLEVLRKLWLGNEPEASSFTLLQSVWLELDRLERSASGPEPLQQVAAGFGH